MARERKQINQINVVPYIDVMLVLLIIFMITAPLINPGQIDLPTVGQQLGASNAPLEVQIKVGGKILLNDRETGTLRELNRAELVRAIKDKLSMVPGQPVVIAADKTVRYEEVMNVMDILQQNQVKRIGLLAKSGKN
ncbi:MAG: protein TolR [Burkholderiales bacterium]